MKFKVIKSFSGIEVGTPIDIAPEHQSYMLKAGYVERIAEQKMEKLEGRQTKVEPMTKKRNK